MVSLTVFAHGNLSIRIAEKTSELAKDSTNATLYFERGKLYQEHEEYDKAINDYLKSKTLGNTDKLIIYQLAEASYKKAAFDQALQYAAQFRHIDAADVKIHKLYAQIVFKLQRYDEAIKSYDLFFNMASDARPEDVIEFTDMILTKDPNNYTGAIAGINMGLDKIGVHTFSLQLKKLELYEVSNQIEQAIDQYNYFILNNQRKEFWYYKKAKYLIKVNRLDEAQITIQQAKTAIALLGTKFQNTDSIKDLSKKIIQLETTINHEN
jgi:tetratricopeptide (TPR) repeat protein